MPVIIPDIMHFWSYANFDQIMDHIHNIADRSITCKDAD